MIVVTGTGRSGTTMFIKALARAGLNAEPMTPGYGEHLESIEINRMIMKARGYFNWIRVSEMVELIGHGIKKIDNDAIKQTDLCHTLDVWWEARQDLEVIVCYRRLDSARKSFRKISGPVRQDLTASACPNCVNEVSVDAWMPFAFGQLMDVILSNGIPHAFFNFPADLDDPAGSYDRLEPILGGKINRQQYVGSLSAVTDRGQVHY